jgi:hypothetical protein
MAFTKSLSSLVMFSDVFGDSAYAEGVIWHIYTCLPSITHACQVLGLGGEWGSARLSALKKLLADHGVTF